MPPPVGPTRDPPATGAVPASTDPVPVPGTSGLSIEGERAIAAVGQRWGEIFAARATARGGDSVSFSDVVRPQDLVRMGLEMAGALSVVDLPQSLQDQVIRAIEQHRGRPLSSTERETLLHQPVGRVLSEIPAQKARALLQRAWEANPVLTGIGLGAAAITAVALCGTMGTQGHTFELGENSRLRLEGSFGPGFDQPSISVRFEHRGLASQVTVEQTPRGMEALVGDRRLHLRADVSQEVAQGVRVGIRSDLFIGEGQPMGAATLGVTATRPIGSGMALTIRGGIGLGSSAGLIRDVPGPRIPEPPRPGPDVAVGVTIGISFGGKR